MGDDEEVKYEDAFFSLRDEDGKNFNVIQLMLEPFIDSEDKPIKFLGVVASDLAKIELIFLKGGKTLVHFRYIKEEDEKEIRITVKNKDIFLVRSFYLENNENYYLEAEFENKGKKYYFYRIVETSLKNGE